MSSRDRRIVLVSRGLDPIGTGRQVLLAARGLVERGWDVHLAIISRDGSQDRSEDGPLATAARAAGATVHPLSNRPASSITPIDPAVILPLAAVLRRCEADLVEAWGWTSAVAGTGAAAIAGIGRHRRRPPLAIRAATPPGRSWPRRSALSLAAMVVADGDAVAAACRDAAPGTAALVVRPGIPIEPLPVVSRVEVADRYGLRTDRPWTLCVAPLEAPARLERLLWAMDQLDVVHAGIEHVLVGAGSQAGRIARRARVQHVTARLHVVPCLRPPIHDAPCDLIPHAALVWQSGEVALGGAILDAMAVGRPIVAVESMAAENLVEDGVSGRIVPADPASEFPRHSLRLIEDHSLATRFGEAARLRAAERFSVDAFHAAHAAALESLTRG